MHVTLSRTLRLALTAAFASAAGRARAQEPAPPDSVLAPAAGSVVGSVVDAESGLPLPGTRVVLSPIPSGVTPTAASSFVTSDRTVTTEVDLVVKIGPVPVYKYRHSARERWTAGRFVSIEATTNGNGKVQKTSARALPGYVQIVGSKGSVRAPAARWSSASAMRGPARTFSRPTRRRLAP